MIGAHRKLFAVIIPGVLYLRRIVRDVLEADLTVSAVAVTVEPAKSYEGMVHDTEALVLDGNSFISRRMALLDEKTPSSVDLAEGQGRNKSGKLGPSHLAAC